MNERGFHGIVCADRSYAAGNKKPLLDSPEKDGDDSWSGWSDSWADKSPPADARTSPEQEGDAWGSWSNENSPTAPTAAEAAEREQDDDGWNNDDWGAQLSSSTTSSGSKKSTAAASNHKKSSKPKHHKSHAAKKTANKKGEPATANLIDFGDSGNSGSAVTQQEENVNDGWDNEVWAQDDDEDAWLSLEVDSAKAKAS